MPSDNDNVSRSAAKEDDLIRRGDFREFLRDRIVSSWTEQQELLAAIDSLPAVDAEGGWEKLRAKLSGRITEIEELVGKPIPGERGILECECDALEEMLEWMVLIEGELSPPAAEDGRWAKLRESVDKYRHPRSMGPFIDGINFACDFMLDEMDRLSSPVPPAAERAESDR